jgi:hypothetical protein
VVIFSSMYRGGLQCQEGRYVVGYEREDRDVDEILSEFELEPITDYFARSRRVRLEKL